MSDGFMSTWSIPAACASVAGASDEAATAGRLPGVHFHGMALMNVRSALLCARPETGAHLGVLRGYRSSEPEDHVLFDAYFPEVASAAIRPGAVVVPLGLAATLRRPWREGRVGGDGSLLKLFGAVASPVLLDDGRGVRLRVRLSLPRFQLTRWPPLRRGEGPRVAEVSLGIVLSGGDTVREGEHVGFLVRDARNSNVVEPVLLSDRVGRRGIVGMWTLSERDVWTAAAVFAADSITRRNTKVGRPGREPSGARRQVHFLVAQFHERVGGDPMFIPCMATLPAVGDPQNVLFSAQVSAQPHDPAVLQGGVVSASFTEETADGGSVGVPFAHAGVEDAGRSLHTASRINGGGGDWNDDGTTGPGALGDGVEEDAGVGSGALGVGDDGEVAAVRGVRSPASEARKQLDRIARQMRQLQADLDEFPAESPPGPLPCEARPRTEHAPCPVGARVPATSHGGPDAGPRPLAPSDSPAGVQEEAGVPQFIPASLPLMGENEVELDKITDRLDSLATKYIGDDYWSELRLDHV
jgi:hypothetical protein